MHDWIDLEPLEAQAVTARVPQRPPDELDGKVVAVRDDHGQVVDWQLRASTLLAATSTRHPLHRRWANWRRTFRPSAVLGPAAVVRSWPGWEDVHGCPTVPDRLVGTELVTALDALSRWRERHLDDRTGGVELQVDGRSPRWRLPCAITGTLAAEGNASVTVDDGQLWLSGPSGTRPVGDWQVRWDRSPVTVTVDVDDIVDDPDEGTALISLAPSATTVQVRRCRTLQVYAPLVAGLTDITTASLRAGGHVTIRTSETVLV